MVNVKFSLFTVDTLFDNPETFDFNDRYYGYVMANNAYIVTNDADFSDIVQCDIITKNASLLKKNK